MNLFVSPTGNIACIYAEDVNLGAFGNTVIERASHVEPCLGCGWIADLSPITERVLGPYKRRSEALAAEIRWLDENWQLWAAKPASEPA